MRPEWFVVYWTTGAWTAFRDPLAAQMLADSMRQPVVTRDALPPAPMKPIPKPPYAAVK